MAISTTQSLRVFSAVICALMLAAIACSWPSGTPVEIQPAITILPAQDEIGPAITVSANNDEIEPAITVHLPQVFKSEAEPHVDRTHCGSAGQIHPVGESIARNYDLPYDDVISIYCAGYNFEDILLALESEAQSGMAAQDILEMRADGLSWDEIWRELGLIG
jgi:hypothetical protein